MLSRERKSFLPQEVGWEGPRDHWSYPLILRGKQKGEVFALSKASQPVENQPQIPWLQMGVPLNQSASTKPTDMQIYNTMELVEGKGRVKAKIHSRKPKVKLRGIKYVRQDREKDREDLAWPWMNYVHSPKSLSRNGNFKN